MGNLTDIGHYGQTLIVFTNIILQQDLNNLHYPNYHFCPIIF